MDKGEKAQIIRYAQYIELGRSFTPDQHRSPDRTTNLNI